MPTQKCLEEIQKEQPPFNRACSDALCAEVRAGMDAHCQTKGLAPDTPVMGYDKSVGGICYCCCSCYTLDTPIEVTAGEFILIQDINSGDKILTAGVDLNWTQGIVQSRTGTTKREMISGLYLVRYMMPNEKEARELIVTADHLFMTYKDRTLKKVQNLIPRDKLLTATGEIAEVVFSVSGDHKTAIQSITMEGEFDGINLSGHLINANGIVSTDYTVQAYYETNQLSNDLRFTFGNPEKIFEVGTKEYSLEFPSEEREAFLENHELWPKGFYPQRAQLINVPKTAHRFFTINQENDIKDNGVFNAYSGGASRDTINKLFAMFRSYNSKINYVLDWDSKYVNVSSWTSGEQSFVVMSGGMARIQGLFSEGYLIIIAAMTARLKANQCVTEGDYKAIDILRTILPNSIYGVSVPAGIEQVENGLFKLIDAKHYAGNPKDVCENPSIECRSQSLWAGLSFYQLPKCGIPENAHFNFVNAYANFDLKSINVIFDEAVNSATGQSAINYAIQPDVIITQAIINDINPKMVVLIVEGLNVNSKYLLSITNVTSVLNQTLPNDEANTIIKIG